MDIHVVQQKWIYTYLSDLALANIAMLHSYFYNDKENQLSTEYCIALGPNKSTWKALNRGLQIVHGMEWNGMKESRIHVKGGCFEMLNSSTNDSYDNGS